MIRSQNIPGVMKFITAKDIPGVNNFIAAFNATEPIFCDEVVNYAGEGVGIIVAGNTIKIFSILNQVYLRHIP